MYKAMYVYMYMFVDMDRNSMYARIWKAPWVKYVRQFCYCTYT